jgi:hypothetical protein
MAPLFFSRCVWQRIISLKLQFDWECDDKPVDLAVYSILGQTHAIQTAINKNSCPTYLPIIHWLLCIHIQYITLFITQDFSWISPSPIFFISSTWKNICQSQPPMVQYWIYSNHVEATLRPVLHGGPAGSPLSSSSLRGRWGMTPVDGFFLRKNWCLTLFNLQHRGFRWWLLTCWEGGAFWGWFLWLLDWYLNDHCWIDIGYSFNDIDGYFEDHPTNSNW